MWVLALSLALALPEVCVAAEAPKVLLVYPSEAQPSVTAALVRVRGELVADGFDVVLVRARPGTSSSDAMGEAQNNVDSATVGLFLSADGASAELWVVDKFTDKTVVRRVNTSSETSSQLSEVMAVRAVELLRASLLEFLVAQRQSEAKQPAAHATASPALPREVKQKAAAWAAKPLTRSTSWNAEAGPSLFLNPGQAPPQFGFVASVRGQLLPVLDVRVSSIGLGSSPRIDSVVGSAKVQQWFGFGQAVFLPWPSFSMRPTIILGAGAYHLSVDGTANWPYKSKNSSVWAIAGALGLGLECKISERLAVVAEGHALLSAPYPGLYFVSHRESKVGAPTLAATFTLKVSL